MASRSLNLYIGITSRLRARVLEHKTGAVPGYTSTYKCVRLVYFEQFGYVDNAIRREKELKGWRREKKIALIRSVNPAWQDLAEKWCSAKELQVPRRVAPRDDKS